MENSGEYRSSTGCVCPLAGYCDRHKIKKNPHFHHLCQTRQDYFDMYEKCVGPGQEFTNCKDGQAPPVIIVDGPIEPCPGCKEPKKTAQPYTPPAPSNVQMPSLWQQAKNLTKSVVEHTKTGGQNVTAEEKQARLDICNSCEFFNKDNNRCGKCGCMMQIKTGWASSSCPLNPPKWGRGADVK
jgi:hypothetical protein